MSSLVIPPASVVEVPPALRQAEQEGMQLQEKLPCRLKLNCYRSNKNWSSRHCTFNQRMAELKLKSQIASAEAEERGVQ